MFLLMAKPALGEVAEDGSWITWERFDLTATLIEAEGLYKSGCDWDCVKVLDVEGVIVKAKWGPEDPGGIFNTEHDEIPGR